MKKAQFDLENLFGTGAENTAYAQYFVGTSYLKPLTGPDSQLPMFNVTFAPGCRNNWHVHRASKGGGQMLICTAGEGWYQADGTEPLRLVPGTVVEIPANVRHWHGAAADSWFSHIAFTLPGEDCGTQWLEPVESAVYGGRLL